MEASSTQHLLARRSTDSSCSSLSDGPDQDAFFKDATKLTRYPTAQAAPDEPIDLESDDESVDTEEEDYYARNEHLSTILQKPGAAAQSRVRCCLMALGFVAAVWALVSIIGFFTFRKYKKAPATGFSPPWYPTPLGGTAATWAESYKKAQLMVANMTLAEKVNITTGTGWSMGLAVGNTGPATLVGFPQLALQDGPLGIRFSDNSTAFPAGITVGATWNRELMYARGKAHGLEARLKGINVLLSPCVGPLGRMPAGGRNWEGFGADPYLQGVAGAQTLSGIQSEHVMATIKHFIGNEQEHFRQSWEWGLANALSSNIDDRTLHEMYAWPFADAVRAGVASVMCSYNMVNNSYACANSKLLNGILKDELGFQGFVMSDWLAQRSGVASALAGLDMTMPGDGLGWMDGKSLWGSELTRAVLNASVPMDRVNDMATRIVAAWYQLGQDDETLFDRKGPNFSSWTDERYGNTAPASPSEQETVEVNKYVNVQKDHNKLARQIAVEGTVLLKNEGVLPLKRDGSVSSGLESDLGPGPDSRKVRIAVFGEDAGPGQGPNHCKDRGCNQGTLGSGWGSGAVEFPFLVAPIEALRREFDSSKVRLTEVLTNDPDWSDKGLLEQDICLVFANADSGEGFLTWNGIKGDRNDLFLQLGGDALIKKVAEGCGGGSGHTIVVMHTVGPVVVEKWIDLPGVKAVIFANLPGEESGNALTDVLFGDQNPSGHLPFTVGRSLQDYGAGGQVMYLPNGFVPQQNFNEGLYIDYRHFDKHGIEPRFPFGFGLSYTSFKLSNLHIESVKEKSALPSARPNPAVQPPKYSKRIPSVMEGVLPTGFKKMENYIYPYLNSASDVVPGAYPYPDGYSTKQPLSEAGGDQGGNPDLWEVYAIVHVDVRNTGSVVGKAVPQLYMSYPEAAETNRRIDFPMRVLRGFEKVSLDPGQTTTVQFNLTRRDLSFWDVQQQNWVMLTEGQYKLWVGESSRGDGVEGLW
ncbi:hypothetical protein TD95_004249 [Thielaviopsis punctulata]|uniref:beta-glucosidase n=1 Tax=Thielaviopsis punctulata TaxID=72032 RepID=A0A0F4Z831_9PEZI|nr:hypothetical protein TD95_004249 [Thielaviopsis punctulata]